jgi:sporulation protein YlmC with PRC-barrel domain
MKAKSRAARVTGVTVVILALLAGGAGARVQPGAPAGQDQQVTPAAPAPEYHPQLEKTSTLVGARVVGGRGKYLGTIGDIVLTPDRKAIDYIVLFYGGFWSVPQKLFAVPWPQFQAIPGQKAFALNGVTWKELRNVRGFDKNHWPSAARENWVAAARAGEAISPVPVNDMRYRRLTGLTGMTVVNDQKDVLGTIEDFVVDVRDERVAYAVLALGPECPGVPRNLVAVPWPAIEIQVQVGLAGLNTDPQTLAAMAFPAANFPDLENPQYSRQLYERFGVTPYWQALGYVPPEPQTTPPQAPTDQGRQ